MTYEQTKARALTNLGHLQAGAQQLQEILKNAKGELPTLQTATDLTDAAKKVVAAVAA